jgi:hypothetical protein
MKDRNSFGTNKRTIVDRLGVWLSQLSLKSELGVPEWKKILDVGSGTHVSNLTFFQTHEVAFRCSGFDFTAHSSENRYNRSHFRLFQTPSLHKALTRRVI